MAMDRDARSPDQRAIDRAVAQANTATGEHIERIKGSMHAAWQATAQQAKEATHLRDKVAAVSGLPTTAAPAGASHSKVVAHMNTETHSHLDNLQMHDAYHATPLQAAQAGRLQAAMGAVAQSPHTPPGGGLALRTPTAGGARKPLSAGHAATERMIEKGWMDARDSKGKLTPLRYRTPLSGPAPAAAPKAPSAGAPAPKALGPAPANTAAERIKATGAALAAGNMPPKAPKPTKAPKPKKPEDRSHRVVGRDGRPVRLQLAGGRTMLATGLDRHSARQFTKGGEARKAGWQAVQAQPGERTGRPIHDGTIRKGGIAYIGKRPTPKQPSPTGGAQLSGHSQMHAKGKGATGWAIWRAKNKWRVK